MSITVGATSTYPFPTMPFPLTGEGFIDSQANIVPHNGTLVDNIVMPTVFGLGSTGQIHGRLGEVAVWSADSTDIRAGSDGFMAVQMCHYDNVNDRLYMWALDISVVRSYVGYITLETGIVTAVGSGVFLPQAPYDDWQVLSGFSVQRPAPDSGDFLLRNKNVRLRVNSETGVGTGIFDTEWTTEGKLAGSYITQDGLISLHKFQVDGEAAYIEFSRSVDSETTTRGDTVQVAIPSPLVAAEFSSVPIINALPWGDTVKLLGEGSAATGSAIIRTFNRAEFDTWLLAIAKFGGLA